MNSITVNNITYAAKPFDFNMVCTMEEFGINLEQLETKPFSAIRAYLSICANMSIAEAGDALQKHVVGGGKIGEISEVMGKEMEESDFFRALNQTAEQETPEVEKEAPKAKRNAKA